MTKPIVVRKIRDFDEGEAFFNQISPRRPPQEGDYVIYLDSHKYLICWGKLKWGKCKWVGSNICRTIACNGGLYLGPKEDKTCAGFRGKLFMVPMSYEEMLVHML